MSVRWSSAMLTGKDLGWSPVSVDQPVFEIRLRRRPVRWRGSPVLTGAFDAVAVADTRGSAATSSLHRQLQRHAFASAQHRHIGELAGFVRLQQFPDQFALRRAARRFRRSPTITSSLTKPAFFAAACLLYWPTPLTCIAIASAAKPRSLRAASSRSTSVNPPNAIARIDHVPTRREISDLLRQPAGSVTRQRHVLSRALHHCRERAGFRRAVQHPREIRNRDQRLAIERDQSRHPRGIRPSPRSNRARPP